MQCVVATWNVAHGAPEPSGLGPAVASFAADLVALQEVDVGVPGSGGTDQLGDIARSTGMDAVFGEVSPFRGGRYGNALLARGRVERAEVLRLPVPRRRRRPRRAALVAEVVLASGARVSIATAHLGLRHAEASVQLRVVLDALAARPLPRVLLGDLNLRPEHVAPWVVPEGYGLAGGPPTYPATAPRLRIDHVAARGATIEGCSVVRLPVSDHRAVVAGLRLT